MADHEGLADQLFPRGDVGRRRTGRRRVKSFEGASTPGAAEIFREEPVGLSEFVTDSRFLNNPPLSPIQSEAVRHAEQIYLPSTYDLMVREFDLAWAPQRSVNFVWLQWGKGSGKDHVARVIVARVCYLLGCLRNPQGYFGLPGQDSIHVLNVAASEDQARKAFFEPLRRMIARSLWFQDRFEARSGGITFDNGVELISGHSRAETQEGLNLLVGIADEISEFRTDDEAAHLVKASGREPSGTAGGVLRMMKTSGRTRFPENFKVVALSWPRFKGDPIQALTSEGREDNERNGDRSRVYVSGPLATWEVNPRLSKEQFQDDYEQDPVTARAKYECDPDIRMNKVFRNESAVYAAFEEQKQEPVTIDYTWGQVRQPDGGSPSGRTASGWHATFRLHDDLRPVPGALYVVHGDLSLSHSRAGVAMAHVRGLRTPAGADTEQNVEEEPVVAIDFVTSFEADLSAEPGPREIQISWFRDLIHAIRQRGFHVSRVSADRFQSADTLQIVQSWGIETAEVSTDKTSSAWETLRNLMYDGRLQGYGRPRLVKELLGLIMLPGGKARAASGGSKDEADAVAGAVLGAIDVGGQEIGPDSQVGREDMFSTGGSLFTRDEFPDREDIFVGSWEEWNGQ